MKTAIQNLLSGLFECGSRTAAGIAVAVGMLALLGWVYDLDVLKSVVPGLPPMKANVTVALILSGISLWIACAETPNRLSRKVSQTCAGAVLLIALATLAENLFGMDFGIDQLLAQDVINYPSDIPGRMSTRVAICLVMLATALWLLVWNSRTFYKAIQILAFSSVLIALSGVVGYAYDIEGMHQVRLAFSPMALHAAATIALLGLGILSASPEFLFRLVMTSDSAAGNSTRRLLLVAIGFPFAAGWLIVRGYRADYFGESVGVALFAVVNMGGLSAVALWNAGALMSTDTRRRQAEEDFRSASLYNRSLLEASLDPLVTINTVGKITDVNEATVQATGVARVALIGSDFSDYFTEPEKARAGYQEVFAKGLVMDYPLTLRNVSGKVREVLYNASVYRNQMGEVTGIFAAARDITERKRDEDEIRKLNAELEQRVAERTAKLEAANKELEGFAYSVSHDLRTPLRAIDGFSQQVLKHYADKLDDEGRRYLNVVRENTRKMAQLIDDILAFSRMGRLEMSVSEVNMEELARTVFEELKPAFAGRELTMKISQLPPCRGDTAMLRQVWVNLLSNAIKFTRFKEAVLVEVGGKMEGAERVYYVKDSGAGFDMLYADKLFGVFQRLHGNEEFEGTGIGLAIVKRIIIRHGGRVWGEGKVDEGATFYFALPGQGA
jgi:PAS domain S-box-containing protein